MFCFPHTYITSYGGIRSGKHQNTNIQMEVLLLKIVIYYTLIVTFVIVMCIFSGFLICYTTRYIIF